MIAVTIVNIVAILLTFLSRYRNFRYGFEIAILLLTIFFGVRYNYGNDYPGYYEMFNEINSYHTLNSAFNNMGIEDGWIVLNRLFAPLGFYALIFCLTIFQFGSLYFFLKKYVKREQLFFVMFLYLFSSNLMLTMLSMMRQCFAMNIILWTIPFIIDKKYFKAIILILLAAQFHQSAYVMLLLLFVPLLHKINYNFYVISMICLFILLFVASNTVGERLAFIVDTYFEKYNEYIDGGRKAEVGSGIGLIFNIIVFCALLFFDKHNNSNQSSFMKILAISYLFIPLGFIVQLIGRVSTYFNLVGLSGYCGIIQGRTNKKIIGYVLMVVLLLFLLYGYFAFFYNDVWHDSFYEYHTILSII